jgi:hypothetical protein
MGNYLTVQGFTPDDPVALALAGVTFVLVMAALVIANKGTRDRF